MEIEYVDTQNETDSPAGSTERPHGYFQIDFVGLDLRAALARRVRGRLEARFTPDEAVDVQQANLRIRDFPLDGQLTVGLRQRLMKPGRKTESYPLAGTAFWKGQDIGLQAGIHVPLLRMPEEGDDLDVSVVAEGSLMNGLRLGRRRIGEDRSFRIIGYEERNWDENGSKEVGYHVGLKGKVADRLRFDLMTFGYVSRLEDGDLDFLAGISGYGNDRSRRSHFYGASARARMGGLTLFGQVCSGRVGLLGRAAWYVQASYELEGMILPSVEPLIRYGVLDIDIPADPADPLTWDRDRLTMALLLEVLPGMEVKTEYTLNGEDTGGSDVKNDELLVQVQVTF